jgi:hypothetical protein
MFGEALSELLDRAGALTHDREAIRTPIGPVHGYMDAAKACGRRGSSRTLTRRNCW